MTDTTSVRECEGLASLQTGLFIGAEQAGSVNALFPSSVALPWQPNCTEPPRMAQPAQRTHAT